MAFTSGLEPGGGFPIPVCIALLRGINVSGHNLIRMTDLKAMCERLGFGRVQTYIQSGNVLFESDDAAAALERRMSEAIRETFAMDVPVMVRTAAEMEAIVRNCPFPADSLPEGESITVAFLADLPSAEGLDRLSAVNAGMDEYRAVGKEIYILYRQSAHKSKLSNNLFEQKLRVASTARNWQTVNKLTAMGKGTA